MSTSDVQELEATLVELEQRIQARIGKWALAILGTAFAFGVMGAANWFGIVNRVERLETWKTERAKPIEEYYETQRIMEGRLSRMETLQLEMKEQLADIQRSLRNK